MTKPSNFILNSDYLALAQTDTEDFTAYFGAETFLPGQAYDRTHDFTVNSSQGAVDMFMISLNGADFVLGAKLNISSVNPVLNIFVYRLGPTTIRVRLHEYNNATGGYSMPMQTVRVKVASFKPPNVL